MRITLPFLFLHTAYVCNVTLVSYIYGMLIPTAYILLGDLTFNGKLCRFLFTIDDHMDGEKSTDSMHV